MTNPLEIAGLIISILLPTGAVAFFVQYGTRLALLERVVETSQLNSLHPRLTLVESAVQEIKASLQELKLLPKIASQLESLQEGFRQMVPRAEAEARWKASDERLETVELNVRNLKR